MELPCLINKTKLRRVFRGVNSYTCVCDFHAFYFVFSIIVFTAFSVSLGSSKAVTRLVSSSSNSNTKLSKLIDQYNDNSNVKITESHRKSGVWPWQDGLLQG